MGQQTDWAAIARHVVAVVLVLLGTYGITVTYAPKTAPVQQPVIFQPAPAAPTPFLAPQAAPPATGAGLGLTAEESAILATLRAPSGAILRKQLLDAISAVK